MSMINGIVASVPYTDSGEQTVTGNDFWDADGTASWDGSKWVVTPSGSSIDLTPINNWNDDYRVTTIDFTIGNGNLQDGDIISVAVYGPYGSTMWSDTIIVSSAPADLVYTDVIVDGSYRDIKSLVVQNFSASDFDNVSIKNITTHGQYITAPEEPTNIISPTYLTYDDFYAGGEWTWSGSQWILDKTSGEQASARFTPTDQDLFTGARPTTLELTCVLSPTYFDNQSSGTLIVEVIGYLGSGGATSSPTIGTQSILVEEFGEGGSADPVNFSVGLSYVGADIGRINLGISTGSGADGDVSYISQIELSGY